MLTVLNDIDKRKYELLIEYAYLRCDMFTLRVPTHLLGEIESLDKIDREFREGIEPKLKIIEPYVTKKYNDDIYLSSIGGICEVYIVSLVKELKSFLLEAERLYNWEYPQKRPEDLCFYSKQECWLGSIAHEDMCWIYAQGSVEKDILRKAIGLQFSEDEEDCVPPKLGL